MLAEIDLDQKQRTSVVAPVLSGEAVVKTFREGREDVPVLRGVDLAMNPGEIVALEGPSGSGKTTFLSILGCILTPSSGRVVVDGEEVDPGRPERLPALRRRAIGFVFQQYNLFPALSAIENVEYALNVKGVRGRAARAEAERVIEAVGLADRRGFLPRDLSGGQKQRVAIARALAGAPPILLADEPTANLDEHAAGATMALFRDFHQVGTTVIVATHDAAWANRLGARLLALDGGRLAS
jgi:putative ABC transport system ATP-binding protein